MYVVRKHVCMYDYVCLYVCMSVCLCVCVFVCLYVRTYIRIYECMSVWAYNSKLNLWATANTHTHTYIYIYAYYKCIYICVCVIYIINYIYNIQYIFMLRFPQRCSDRTGLLFFPATSSGLHPLCSRLGVTLGTMLLGDRTPWTSWLAVAWCGLTLQWSCSI